MFFLTVFFSLLLASQQAAGEQTVSARTENAEIAKQPKSVRSILDSIGDTLADKHDANLDSEAASLPAYPTEAVFLEYMTICKSRNDLGFLIDLARQRKWVLSEAQEEGFKSRIELLKKQSSANNPVVFSKQIETEKIYLMIWDQTQDSDKEIQNSTASEIWCEMFDPFEQRMPDIGKIEQMFGRPVSRQKTNIGVPSHYWKHAEHDFDVLRIKFTKPNSFAAKLIMESGLAIYNH